MIIKCKFMASEKWSNGEKPSVSQPTSRFVPSYQPPMQPFSQSVIDMKWHQQGTPTNKRPAERLNNWTEWTKNDPVGKSFARILSSGTAQKKKKAKEKKMGYANLMETRRNFPICLASLASRCSVGCRWCFSVVWLLPHYYSWWLG